MLKITHNLLLIVFATFLVSCATVHDSEYKTAKAYSLYVENNMYSKNMDLIKKIETKRNSRSRATFKCSLEKQDHIIDYSDWPAYRVQKSAIKGNAQAQYEFAKRLEMGDDVDIDLFRSLKYYGAAMDGATQIDMPRGQGYNPGANMRAGVGPLKKRCSPVEKEALEGFKRVNAKMHELSSRAP